MAPSAQIPPPVTDLEAIERGDKIVVNFHTPPRTTDNAPIERFNQIELRIGPDLVPFDFNSWAAAAKIYAITPPQPVDPFDPQPIAMTDSVPLEGLLGKHVAVAVRTAIKRGDHFSSWSNRIVLNVIDPLQTPSHLNPHSAPEGIALDWQNVPAAQSYRILRQGPSDKDLVEVGKTEQVHFLDSTAQFDVPYKYQVIALNGSSESLPAELEGPFTAKDTFPPSVPTAVTALAGPESVEVSWQRSPETDLAGYYVYRSVDGSSFERQGDMVSLPAYSDHKVEHGKTYRYRISSVDKKNNESDKSAPAQVVF
jgi:hypothetical protein